MKHLFTIALLALCAAQLQAAVLTVNNNNPNPGQYTTVAAAIAAAANNDIILVHGSPNNYGGFTITKPLTIYGAGHEPQVAGGFETYCDEIIINNTGSGSKISGFNANTIRSDYGQAVNNITIELNMIRSQVYAYYGVCSDWVVKNNYFAYVAQCVVTNTAANGSNNWLISHNIFNGYINSAGTIPSNLVITNNVFLMHSNYGSCLNNIQGGLITNNIFYGTAPPAASNVTYSIFSNNLSDLVGSDNALPGTGTGNTGGGNLVAVDAAATPIFTTLTGDNYFQYADNLRVLVSAPAHNTGTDGTDMGVYGSGNTFSETGEPNIPVVNTVTIANPAVPSTGTLNINFTARNPVKDVN